MDEQDYKRLVGEMLDEKLIPSVAEMLRSSEGRIDQAQKMVQQLSDACSMNMEIYDKHLTSLEACRNEAMSLLNQSSDLNKSLSASLRNQRDDYERLLDSLRKELHMLKNEYRKEMAAMRSDYRKLAQSYTRLAESESGGPRATVQVHNS